MKIFFDVDYTWLGPDGTLRPGTREVFERLQRGGHQLYIWSGYGARWPEVRFHGLQDLVVDCFPKPFSDQLHPGLLPTFTVLPDFVVDDYPEIVEFFGGCIVPAYMYFRQQDQEMWRVYRTICEVAEHGTSADPKFRPRPPWWPAAGPTERPETV